MEDAQEVSQGDSRPEQMIDDCCGVYHFCCLYISPLRNDVVNVSTANTDFVHCRYVIYILDKIILFGILFYVACILICVLYDLECRNRKGIP